LIFHNPLMVEALPILLFFIEKIASFSSMTNKLLQNINSFAKKHWHQIKILANSILNMCHNV